MTATRYIEKFSSIDGSVSYTFPLNGYEWQSEQAARVPLSVGVGADYAHDHLGYAASPLDPARERVRCIAVQTTQALAEAALDEARGECYRIGKGWLYRLDADGTTRRRAYARVASMPAFTRSVGHFLDIPLIFDFVRLSPWFATTATTGTETIDETPHTFTINNPGNIPAKWIVFRFRANDTNAMTNLSFTNNTNGMTFSTTRDFTTADHELKVDTERNTVELSANDGSSYASDYSLFTQGQVGIMRLEPGDNEIEVTDGGTPDYDVEWSFYAPFA